ncbi:hypothetical protein BMS3Bbin04_01145 [bacterium BMS3Bbin04]|nr:hypothetical protein BMS3Bbin04_01145 [bacterium BMS3Bbin04]
MSRKTNDDIMSTNGSHPVYELRAKQFGPSDLQLEVWQLPAAASPHLKQPRRIAGLRGGNLDLIQHRLLRQLSHEGIDPVGMMPGELRQFELSELSALRLGLLFRTLAPMRSRPRMAACTEGIEEMDKEEAAYWLGMAMHRKKPRRVLQALRVLLVDPSWR